MDGTDEHIGSLEIKESNLPEVKGWQVGKKYKMTVEVEMTGLNKREDWSADMGPYVAGAKPKKRPKVMFGSFKVTSVKPAGKSQTL